jgi:hypothetical protein
VSLFLKLVGQSRHAVGVRALASAVIVSALLACDPRDTRVGSVSLPGSNDGGADAGVMFRRADAVGPLAMDRCLATAFPRLPLFVCEGASSPPEFQCVVSVFPDGGTVVVRQLPLSGTRAAQRLHGVGEQVVIAEVADTAPGPRVLEAFPFSTMGPAVAVSRLAASSQVSGVGVAANDLDVIVCEGASCALRRVPLDGDGGVELAPAIPTAATGPIQRGPGGLRAWTDDGGVTTWSPTGGVRRVSATGVSRLALGADGTTFFLADGALERASPQGARAVLADTLDAPHAVFALGGFVVVVERRAVRAFPQGGGAPLVLYELPSSETVALANARLVDGRLVFDQRCGAVGAQPRTGRVELDPARGQARWLNEDPRWPFLPGAPGGASRVVTSLREVLAVDGALIGIVE